MSKNRIGFIDTLRAVSLLGVIVIHTFSFHLDNPINAFFWNVLQFVVVAFVFCSGVVSAHYQESLISLHTIFPWYKKRFIRLYIPFLIYFLIHFTLFMIFPNFFTHFGLQKNLLFFIASLTLFGGTNSNWLPLLFIQLTILSPLLFFLNKKNLLWIFILFSMIITGYFTIHIFPYSYYRFVMWIPWALALLLGIIYQQKMNILVIVLSGFIFVISYMLLTFQHHSLLFYDNKYPPTLYYLSFGVLLTVLSSLLLSQIQFPENVQKVFSFISKNSYGLFFIHFIILDFFESTFFSKLYILEMVVVVCASLIVLRLLNFLKSALQYHSNVAI